MLIETTPVTLARAKLKSFKSSKADPFAPPWPGDFFRGRDTGTSAALTLRMLFWRVTAFDSTCWRPGTADHNDCKCKHHHCNSQPVATVLLDHNIASSFKHVTIHELFIVVFIAAATTFMNYVTICRQAFYSYTPSPFSVL